MVKVVLHKKKAKLRETPFESINHSSVWEEQTKTLSFKEMVDSEYFVEHWNGQMDYREAMQLDKEVHFVVYLEGPNGIFPDEFIKKEGWEPYKRK